MQNYWLQKHFKTKRRRWGINSSPNFFRAGHWQGHRGSFEQRGRGGPPPYHGGGGWGGPQGGGQQQSWGQQGGWVKIFSWEVKSRDFLFLVIFLFDFQRFSICHKDHEILGFEPNACMHKLTNYGLQKSPLNYVRWNIIRMHLWYHVSFE